MKTANTAYTSGTADFKKDIDRTLIKANLTLSHETRLKRLMYLQRFADELRRAGRLARHGKG